MEQSNQWKRTVAILFVSVFLVDASYTMVVPFLPLFLVKELALQADNAKLWSGIIIAVTFVFAGVMGPYWGARGDITGQKKNVFRAGIGLTISYFLCAFVQTPFQLFLVRMVMGIVSGFVPACMAIAGSTLPEEKVGWGMGLLMAADASGSITGPLLGGFLSQIFGMRLSFAVSSIFLGLATIAILTMVKEPPPVLKPGVSTKINPVSLLKDLGSMLSNKVVLSILVLYAIVRACTMVIQPLLSLYVNDVMQGDPSAVTISGFILSLAGVAGIIAAPFWGNRGHDFGYVKVLSAVLVCAGFISVLQMGIHDIWLFAGVYFIYGLFLAGAAPNIFSFLVQSTATDERGKAFGLSTAASQLGGAIGPIIGGILGTFISLGHIMGITGCILMLSGLYVYRKQVKKA